MASVKAIAAIAITLIVAVPILMGYGFASEDVESTAWETDSTTNITDLLLNSTTPYYTTLNSPMNNYELMERVTGSGATTTSIVSPVYNDVSSTYSTIAETESGSGSYALTSSVSGSFTVPTYSGTAISYGSEGSDADYSITNYDRLYLDINSDSTSINYLHWQFYFDDSVEVIEDYDSTELQLVLLRDGSGTWSVFNLNSDEEVVTGVSSWMIYTDVEGSTIDFIGVNYTPFNHSYSSAVSFTAAAYTTLMLTYTDESVQYVTVGSDSASVTWTKNSIALIGDTTYNLVTLIDVALPPSYSYIYYSYAGATGNYADPADGWQLPAQGSYTSIYDWWFNEQYNSSVTIMINFTGATSLYFGMSTSVVVSQFIEITYDGSDTYVGRADLGTTTLLGHYDNVMLVMTTDGATAYGLSDWPTMSTKATTYNSVELIYTGVDDFYYVNIASTDRSAANFRVDSAEIVAGTFPSTEDMDFPLEYYYPGQSSDIYLSSIAVYGENITIVNMDDDTTVGTVFEVTDGTITVNDTVIKLLHTHIMTVLNSDGQYVTTIGGEEVMTTDEQPNIDFWGEWSLTASLSTGSEVTVTSSQWAAGEFAFDKEDFAACGLLVAGACLVGLGMTGSRSGVKMGVLLIICGGAGLIYLTLI